MSQLSDRLVTRERLTGPHYLANSWVMKQAEILVHECFIEQRPMAMDFGSRRSELPMMLDDLGYSVIAYDRDPTLVEMQEAVARKHGRTRFTWSVHTAVKQPRLKLHSESDKKYHLVTAVWAVQHNGLLEQKTLLEEFARILKPGGHLLVISSFSPSGARQDDKRLDPQYIVGPDELDVLIASSGLEEVLREYFWYSHGSPDGEWCDVGHANAVAYMLRKPT